MTEKKSNNNEIELWQQKIFTYIHDINNALNVIKLEAEYISHHKINEKVDMIAEKMQLIQQHCQNIGLETFQK